jgi:hypothetical protein
MIIIPELLQLEKLLCLCGAEDQRNVAGVDVVGRAGFQSQRGSRGSDS